MKKIKIALLLCSVLVLNFSAIPISNKITDWFDVFCADKGLGQLQEDVVKKKVSENETILSLIKNCEMTQFAQFTDNENNNFYIFSNYKSPDCGQLRNVNGCFTYKNEAWKEQNDKIPTIDFLDFYGFDQKPPYGFEAIGSYRIVIEKKNWITLTLEPNWVGLDEKKERILSQAKFTAVKLRWNKKESRFVIKKWVR